jgi:hypothetical protein
LQLLILLQLDFRENLESGLASERFVLFIFEIFEAGVAHHRPFLFLDGILEEFGNQRLHNLFSNVVPKVALDQRGGSVAGAKARDSCLSCILRGHPIGLAPNLFDGNFNQEFFLAVRCFHKPSTVVGVIDIRTASLKFHSSQR